ncbi:MAG: hypothetical protein Q9M36_02335 [Sulfurovum sp.]|nr:hypothetical protein [Sulfurovum sp.]
MYHLTQHSKLITLLLLITFFLSSCSDKKEDKKNTNVKKNEKYYQTLLCNELDGIIEKVLKDKTRVDCLTSRYAIEVDFSKKMG